MTFFEYLSYFPTFAGKEADNGTRKTSHPPSTGRRALLLRLRCGDVRPFHKGRDWDFLRLSPELRTFPGQAIPEREDRRCHQGRRADCEGRKQGKEDHHKRIRDATKGTPFLLLNTDPLSHLLLNLLFRIDAFKEMNYRIQSFFNRRAVFIEPPVFNFVFFGPINRVGERPILNNEFHKA